MPSTADAPCLTSTGAVHAPAEGSEALLFARWQSDGDREAREALVRRFLPLARSLARRYGRSSEPFDDLLQVASLGLLKALDRYDVARGYPFRAFAVPTILGEIRRYFRDCGWAVHVPRSVQERSLKVRGAQEHLTNEGDRAPTVPQIARYLNLPTEDVIEALQAMQSYETASLDAPVPGSDEDASSYVDSLGEEDERYELVELGATIASVMCRLPPRERRILRMRFAEDLTQSEIAARVGVSQMQVSRLLRRSLEQLRALSGSLPRQPFGEPAAEGEPGGSTAQQASPCSSAKGARRLRAPKGAATRSGRGASPSMRPGVVPGPGTAPAMAASQPARARRDLGPSPRWHRRQAAGRLPYGRRWARADRAGMHRVRRPSARRRARQVENTERWY
jgi:RNA polymerase sigma-B factor